MAILRSMRVLVIGRIWDPFVSVTCAYEYHPGSSELQPLIEVDEHELNRSVIAKWLTKHAGDFKRIEDFAVLHGNGLEIIGWDKPENEEVFFNCME